MGLWEKLYWCESMGHLVLNAKLLKSKDHHV